MQKKQETTKDAERPTSEGDKAPRDKFATLLKWVGAVTAILSLVFAIHRVTQLVSDLREQQRHIAELREVGKLQQSTADYDGAWASLEQALKVAESGGMLDKLTGQLSKEAIELRQAQEDLAMEWLKHVTRPEGQTFSSRVDKLASVLNRGVANATGARKADILAHVGWAIFLRWRDGNHELDPEPQYRQAVGIDSTNPYAHALWGHWILWRRKNPDDAKQHFAAALASGRVREYVRSIQLVAFRNFGSDGEGEFLAAINDMRKNGEKIDAPASRDLRSIYSFTCSNRYDADRFAKLLAAVPATEQLATFQALFCGSHDEDFDQWSRPGRDACLATLLEAAGQREEALRIWQALHKSFPPKDGSSLAVRAQEAIKRLSPRR